MLRDEFSAAHMSPIRDRPLRSQRRAVVFLKSDFRCTRHIFETSADEFREPRAIGFIHIRMTRVAFEYDAVLHGQRTVPVQRIDIR
jgi:hypothetical protein